MPVEDAPDPRSPDATLVARLRAAGCVFAEEEAALILEAASSASAVEDMVRRRVAGEFLEHVLGFVDFAGVRLSIGPGCFVPRQRSVHLAQVALAEASRRPAPVVVEAYCGVAPLATVVARALPEAQVHATDVAEAPLVHARRNLGSADRVVRGNRLGSLDPALRSRIDVLVAVPPYVPDAERSLMPRESQEFEDGATVYAGADGLDEVRALIAEAKPWLALDGVVLLEMHEDQAGQVLAEEHRAGEIIDGDEDARTCVLRLHAGRD